MVASKPVLALHAHCYQPDRRDPWSGRIPVEAGAAPFHDFNRKIAAQCYRPNAELGNFEGLSFDFGPTLASWLERSESETWRRIVEAEATHRGAKGPSNALASGFHHTLLPLASRADKELQVGWGVADYVHRFARRPQGFWLPETAADIETLSVLAEHGIRYTLLAPWQAEDEAAVDRTRPHWVELPAGRRIAVFFYHRELSAALSFDDEATANADRFATRLARQGLVGGASDGEPGLLLLASDGELYGHHKKFRDLFLAQLLGEAAQRAGFDVSTPARYLEAHPPRSAVALTDVGSWSCHHGVERWRAECPCTPGAGWKAPLRTMLDQLAMTLDSAYLSFARQHLRDPWAVRRRWVEVVLGQRAGAEVLAAEAAKPLVSAVVRQLELLLAAQLQRQRMFTSCGWFFSDPEGLEPGYNLAAAAAAIVLTRAVTGEDAEPAAMAELNHEAATPLVQTLRRALRLAEELIRV